MAEISVSLLPLDEENPITTFYNLETAKIDYFHIDVLDGKFAIAPNNIEHMKNYCLTLSHITNIGLDVHLMVNEVEKVIDEFVDYEPQIITFHYEAVKDKNRIMDIIQEIKNHGAKVGISINPETSIEKIKEFLPYIHQVLIMTIVPGKSGQKLLPETINKIKELKEYILNNNLETFIEVDGGINDKNAKEIIDSGADILVSASYVLNSDNYSDAIKKLKGEIV